MSLSIMDRIAGGTVPTVETLRFADGDQAFPIALEPFGCTRFAAHLDRMTA